MSSWLDTASDNDVLLLVSGMIPMPEEDPASSGQPNDGTGTAGKIRPEDSQVEPGVIDLRSNDDHDDSAMISLDLDPADYPDVAEPHITVVYLGKGLSQDQLDQISARVHDVAANRPPLQGMIGGQGTFAPSDASDGKIPVVAKVNIPGVESLHNVFHDVDASTFPTYEPHMTQTYVDSGEDIPAPIPPTPVIFTHLSLHRTGDVVEQHPFAAQRIEPTLETRDWVKWDEEHRPFGRGHYRKSGDSEAEEAWSRGHHEVSNETQGAKALGHALTDRDHRRLALKEAAHSFRSSTKRKLTARQRQLDQAYHEGRAHAHHDLAGSKHVQMEGFKGVLAMGGFRIEPGQLGVRDWAKWDAEHDYHGLHQAPGPDYADPMHALGSVVLPSDMYDKKTQLQYYGTGDRKVDRESFAAVNASKGKPDAMVRIYRAAPTHVTEINPGDWVTPSKSYAEQHRDSNMGEEDAHVIFRDVRAKELFTNGDSINEWGWHPTTRDWAKWDLEHESLEKTYGQNPSKGENFKQFMDAKGDVDWNAYHDASHAWDYKIGHALSMGKLTDPEAKALGYGIATDEKWEPLPPDLYHVTTAAEEVTASGKLKSRDELNMGLGHGLGGGDSSTISFTANHDTAQTIKNAMLEARSVARGDTSIADLVEQARRGEGAKSPYLADIIHGIGNPQWKEGDPLPSGLQALIDGKKIRQGMMSTVEKINAQHPSPTTPWEPAPFANKIETEKMGTVVSHFQRDMTPEEKANDALDFYKRFSLWRWQHGGPEDPLFFMTDAQALAATKPEDVQVVHAQPKPGAQGFQMSALGEWRTKTGDNVDIVGTRWWYETHYGIEPGVLYTRDWTEWDLEHASMHHARSHIAEAAGRFHDEGGTIERLETGDPKLRAATQELLELHQHLVVAKGGQELPRRVESGFQVAHVALTTPRAMVHAVVHIARTKEGHIAAVMASHPRPVLRTRSRHLALLGSTGITHGAGSALTRVLMGEAAKNHLPVTLEPLNPSAGRHWGGNLGAHEAAGEYEHLMGWTPEEVEQLAKAA